METRETRVKRKKGKITENREAEENNDNREYGIFRESSLKLMK